MNDRFHCGNHETLVSYLYDECEAAERDEIAAHLAQCASCAEEVASLRDTRAHLAAWTPPALPLGFQITRAEETPPATVLRPAAWWRQPLPAWAQAAAAVAIFAAGLSAGTARSTPRPAAVTAAVPAARPVAAATSVSRDDLVRLEQRLRAIESAGTQRVAVTATPGAAVDERALLTRVGRLVDERIALSEDRQQDLMLRLARGVDAHTQMTQRVAAVQGTTVQELQQQRDALMTLRTVSFQQAPIR
jgi:anti-sigma factor RsiW